MKEPSELSKALEVVLKASALEQANNRERGYASPPVVTYGEENSPEGEVHLRDYWRTIRKRLWLIIGVAVIISSIAAIRQARLPDRYTARARVQVDAESYSPALGASKGSTYYIDNTYVDPEYFNTQLQILTSPTLLRRVAKNLDLEHNRNFFDSQTTQRSTWQSLLRMVGMDKKTEAAERPNQVPVTADNPAQPLKSTTGSVDEPGDIARLAPYVSELNAILEVEPVKRTRLIDIRATHTDPKVATKVSNAVANAFGLWNLEVRTKTNSIAGTYLQKRIAELQDLIRNGEEQLVNYAQSHQILSLDSTQNTVVERLAGLNKQLLDAENERNLAEAAYRSSLAPGAAAANAEVSDKQIGDLRTKLSDLKQKKVQLLLTDTEESPEVKDVTEQINTLEKQLIEARSNATNLVTTNLETNYRKALAREQALRESFEKQRSETVTQNQAAINYNILKQEIQTNKGLLEGLMQRAKENDVSMAGTPNNIHVVDYASEPDTPVGPRRLQSVMIALVLSLAFGVALALFLEYLDDTVKSPEDVERGLRLPALAVIPLAGRSARQRLMPFAGKQQHTNGNGTGRELLLNAEGPTVEAEAYRHLRTSVLLSTPGRQPRTLLVTSSVPSEGKTTTVVNMATVLSQTDAKVLVIDADMRRPRLHHVFGMENRAGLSSLLSSEITADELLSVVNRYGESNIYLLSSGPIPPNPAELLGSDQMRTLIARASSEFKYVIVDSPPIASFTDGVLISAIVDGVLLVVQGGKTSRQVVKRTRQMLQEIGAKVIGVVLNKIDLRSQDYYYYHQDYKNYYYSESSGNESGASKALAAGGKN
ncbi:MAG TPA: polysaccharide biosynthesis tyrosine autokinase [Pyrinomonadaceae bacterium]|nr:polysaccharide biosynthesis tyrosine autokinase [Pyrinomonadaceae bacterium]